MLQALIRKEKIALKSFYDQRVHEEIEGGLISQVSDQKSKIMNFKFMRSYMPLSPLKLV